MPEALEAAHLVPAGNGENDISCNGIMLRADLHRPFIAGLFTFSERGRVMTHYPKSPSFADYRQLLRNQKLPLPTFARVRATPALLQFREKLSVTPAATTSPRPNS